MFSRDNRHYRKTPRTVQDAFGPYHRFDIAVCKRHERLCAIVGVIVLGVLFAVELWWRG
jgi:hypothetical protein